jgi:hypothetical protein
MCRGGVGSKKRGLLERVDGKGEMQRTRRNGDGVQVVEGMVSVLILQSCNASSERIDGKLRNNSAIKMAIKQFTIDRAYD